MYVYIFFIKIYIYIKKWAYLFIQDLHKPGGKKIPKQEHIYLFHAIIPSTTVLFM